MKAFFATLMAILVAALIIWLVYDVSSDFNELAKQKVHHKLVEQKIKEQQEQIKWLESH